MNADFGRETAMHVHSELKKLGTVTIPREFVFMDRAAIGLGGVFMRLRARANWHRMFESLIDGFTEEGLAQRQADGDGGRRTLASGKGGRAGSGPREGQMAFVNCRRSVWFLRPTCSPFLNTTNRPRPATARLISGQYFGRVRSSFSPTITTVHPDL